MQEGIAKDDSRIVAKEKQDIYMEERKGFFEIENVKRRKVQ